MPVTWHPLHLKFPLPSIADPETHLRRELRAALAAAAAPTASTSPSGPPRTRERAAVAVGSRGIANLRRWVRVLVEELRRAGVREVVVVPAMGSHGGGTPRAQARVLADLGIAPDTVGAKVVSEAALVQAGSARDGTPVWTDSAAWSCGWVVPLNRVKPHTAFRGRVESGPAKLLAVGLGKAASAAACHRAGLADAIPAALACYLDSGRVPCGVALVENARHQVAALEVLRPATWLEQEAALLQRARHLLPRLPWDELHLLVVEQIGKDISGTGMDLNVIGLGRRFADAQEPPHILQVVALDLSDASHGNANGVGYADVVTRRLADKVDWEVTRANSRTTGFSDATRLPFVAADETQAVEHALAELAECEAVGPEGLRAVRITDTASLESIQVSPALLRSIPQATGKSCG